MSASTAAPVARARSDGWKLLTKGAAAKPAPTAPRQLEVMIQVRLAAIYGADDGLVTHGISSET